MGEERGPYVVVDNRERNAELLSRLEELGVEVRVQTLPVGDYVVSDRVCIERKTVSDFESSIVNGRLFEQAKRLVEAYGYPIMIIEGEREEFRMKSAALNGAIASLYIDYSLPVMVTFSGSETAEMINYIAKHEQEKHMREPSVKGGVRSFTNNQFRERVIGNMPGIGLETARGLLSHFGSIRAIALADQKELMKVKNVGKKRAKAILELLSSEYEREEEDEEVT
jgi:Fanconi anemia group M protein